jgi:hypothetical protein
MISASLAMTLAVAANSVAGWFDRPQTVPAHVPNHNHVHVQTPGPRHHHHHGGGGWILPPGPGDGWGFPNGSPDGLGWYSVGDRLPLGADRTPEYYFPRYLAVPPEQMFIPTYYNPYVTRGQRYIPYAGGGGDHPAGGPPISPSIMPMAPKYESEYAGTPPPQPTLNGRTDAPPINSGSTGLTP